VKGGGSPTLLVAQKNTTRSVIEDRENNKRSDSQSGSGFYGRLQKHQHCRFKTAAEKLQKCRVTRSGAIEGNREPEEEATAEQDKLWERCEDGIGQCALQLSQ